VSIASVCDGSAWLEFMIASRSTPSFFAASLTSTLIHLSPAARANSGERMYTTRPLRPSMIISMVGSTPPSCACASAGSWKRIFSAPERVFPSNTPAPLNAIPPTPSMFIVAVKATRDDSDWAVLVAALATGSNESVSPPQPASPAAHAARHSNDRTRRTLME
jgi:hypothetical protein